MNTTIVSTATASTSCAARTPAGLRTPTGDYMVCAGGHAVDDPHGAGFGTSGWFTWMDEPTPAETAARYRKVASHCRRLAAVADYDGWLAEQDELAMCRCQLAKAGRLDLIEAA